MERSYFALCLAGAASPTPNTVWSEWSFAPAVTLPLLVALGWWVRQVWRSRAERFALSGALPSLCFGCGLLVLAVALVSPLCRIAATLASAHMVQHALLVAIAPPLLVIGVPTVFAEIRLPRQLRGFLDPYAWRGVGPLFASTVLYGLLIWAWHVPAFYQGALLNIATHLFLYATLLGAGLWFWAEVLYAERRGDGLVGASVFALFVTLLHTAGLGVLLTLSRRPWYPLMAQDGALWGLTPLEDQQLAGVLMWVPMGMIYLAAALVLVARWLRPAATPTHLPKINDPVQAF